MSYRFSMDFKNLPKEQIFDFCTDLTELFYKQAEEIIEKNIYYAPSNSHDFKKEQNRIVDTLWLHRLFNLQFVYWEDKKLLGVVGDVTTDNIKIKFDKRIDFQNSADQNYDYSDWDGIEYFEQIVGQIKNMSAEQFIAANANDDYDIDDINENLDYFLKTRVYETIYKELELDSWLWGNPGNFKRFAFNAITSEERKFELYAILKKLKIRSLS